MGQDLGNLSLPLRKVLHLGEIDRWLRGVANIVPQPCGDDTPDIRDFNTHKTRYGDAHGICRDDIQSMVGFRHLLRAASGHNVRVDIRDDADDTLSVTFFPDQSFSKSRVFGTTYANVLPVLFGTENRL